ncbi:hypothetical protein FIBSPDRAFT_14162 [Athelia psychrophila]|uniref:Uncharacterized protein n=1 Tax=Athelia psychrophila TaxID=1759441 RepID=A0A166XDX8_9AGAM|nr:hypothetical protein FIBSPDRAFT_14162 [Fibularhizoctonia sp. CBS 109695]
MITISELHSVAQSTRVPPEIWSEIFLLSLPSGPDIPSWHRYASQRLTLVCSNWRRISLNTQKLWSSFATRDSLKWEKGDIALAQMWLTRSGTSPLTLDIHLQYHAVDLLRLLITHAHRWQHVQLDISHTLQTVVALSRLHLPQLQSLTMPVFESPRKAPSTRFFLAAPRLHSLDLQNVSNLGSAHQLAGPTMSSMPWMQLKHCSISGMGWKECFYIWEHSPNLVSFTFMSPRTDFSDIKDCSPISLLSLGSLRLHASGMQSKLEAAHIFARATLPVLRTLDYEDTTEHRTLTPWPRFELLAFLSRSMCSIQRLRLIFTSSDSLSDVVLLELLPSVPSLTELHIGRETRLISPTLLRELSVQPSSPTSDNPPLLPMLKTFRLDITSNNHQFDDKALVNMIASRRMPERQGVAKLQSVRINRYDAEVIEIREPAREELARLAREGLEFAFVSEVGDL